MLVGMRRYFEFESNACWKTSIVVHKLMLALSLPTFHFSAPGILVYGFPRDVAF